jgi:hypothetical protein
VRAHEVYSVNVPDDKLADFIESTWGEQWTAAVGLQTRAERDIDLVTDEEPAHVFDTGGQLMVSGRSRMSVLMALDELGRNGAQVLSPIQKVGNKWIATCEPAPPPGDGCKVEEIGFMRIITGPTRESVSGKLAEMIDKGARPVHDLEEARGVWTAVCEINP